MLLGLRHPDGVEAGAEYAQEIAKQVGGSFRIFEPSNYAEYAATLKEYKPSAKDSLILLKTHFDYIQPPHTDVESVWRLNDMIFNQLGGTIWGESTELENGTYMDALRDDPEIIIKTALYHEGRAVYIRKTLGTTVLTRSNLDPHTILYGYKFNGYPKISNGANYLLSSLTSGVDYGWLGTAFVHVTGNVNIIKKTLNEFSEANVVAIGENAHNRLEELEVEHCSVPLPPSSGRVGVKTRSEDYGLLIRELTSHIEKVDETTGQPALNKKNYLDWKP